MLKEAIEKIAALAAPTLLNYEDATFVVTQNGIEEVREPIDTPDTLLLNSLDALVKLVKTETLRLYCSPLYITIPTHKAVSCFTSPYDSERMQRRFYYEVKATDVPGWEDETTLGFEQALIALRTRFQQTNDTLYLLKLLSEITSGATVTRNDNGIATTVVSKKGIDLQQNEVIRPIVGLKPYRTFQEVEQPESQFLIRVSERGISFVEADGGMWKLAARNTIKSYLEEAFADEVTEGTVVIAL